MTRDVEHNLALCRDPRDGLRCLCAVETVVEKTRCLVKIPFPGVVEFFQHVFYPPLAGGDFAFSSLVAADTRIKLENLVLLVDSTDKTKVGVPPTTTTPRLDNGALRVGVIVGARENIAIDETAGRHMGLSTATRRHRFVVETLSTRWRHRTPIPRGRGYIRAVTSHADVVVAPVALTRPRGTPDLCGWPEHRRPVRPVGNQLRRIRHSLRFDPLCRRRDPPRNIVPRPHARVLGNKPLSRLLGVAIRVLCTDSAKSVAPKTFKGGVADEESVRGWISRCEIDHPDVVVNVVSRVDLGLWHRGPCVGGRPVAL
mmetsp:Transcript_47273/g.102630  ORF Transcript_47273/g.102630 Transcript_47273/m.102630 type:complete len:313 (+) Transcript_47273:845-1783(+)